MKWKRKDAQACGRVCMSLCCCFLLLEQVHINKKTAMERKAETVPNATQPLGKRKKKESKLGVVDSND